MKNYLEELRTRRVLRVVTVIQPPFMIVSNNTTSKENTRFQQRCKTAGLPNMGGDGWGS